MTFQQLVKNRRSIRRYLEKPVEREKILTCIEAARLAPSADNVQPCQICPRGLLGHLFYLKIRCQSPCPCNDTSSTGYHCQQNRETDPKHTLLSD